jgi:CBS domain-containing protein
MPYTAQDLIENQGTVVTVMKQDPVLKALSLMTEHDFSQLPVIDENNCPLGMVTYESILKGLRNFNLRLDDLTISNVMQQAYMFHKEDVLADLLERLQTANAVLIVDADSSIAGIVTTYDSTEYFRRYAEDLMLVEDIEGMIKDFIIAVFSNDEDELDEARLKEAISTHTHYKEFERLSLGNYIKLLLIEESWEKLKGAFELPTPEAVRNYLDGIRRTRNALAHFQGDISPDQRMQLRDCADWLNRCWNDYEEQRTLALKDSTVIVKTQVGIADGVDTGMSEETIPSDSRYAPLSSFLQGQPGNINRLQLTFQEIEEIIGGSLPTSAYKHRNWWDNNPENHPQSTSWLDVGWRVGYRNISKKTIKFVRIKEREKAYIDFYSALLHQLRAENTIPVGRASPDGASWIIVVQDYQITFFGFSFARGKRFRVELYLDTGEQDTTKQLFDLLYEQRDVLEEKLGEISWERLNEKRASRIAKYHPGEITDNEEDLADLRDWAVDTMIEFYNTISNPLATATESIR